METSDRPAKKVKFTSDTKDNPNFTPLAKKPNTAKLRIIWLRFSREQQYEQLKEELELYQKRGGTLERFFEKEGQILLKEALLSNPEHLAFMVENVPKESIQQVLQRKNYSLLHSFLLTMTGLEEYDKFDEKELKGCIEKIQRLLNIEPNIKEILTKSLEDKELGEKIKKSIKEALTDTGLRARKSNIP